jgi:hypothetical protein
MIHYNFVSGPGQDGFTSCVRYLQERYLVQPAALTVALFNNSTSKLGKPFPESMYKLDRVTAFLTQALGPAHNTMTVTRYKFDGTIGLMDNGGNVWGSSGPTIQDAVDAKNMGWQFGKPHKDKPRRSLIGQPTPATSGAQQ